MSEINKASSIEAAAAAWFERREWSDWDADSELKLEAWLSAAIAHRVAYVRLVAAWERVELLKSMSAGVAVGQVPARGPATREPPLDPPDRAPAISEHLEETMPGLVQKARSRRYRWMMAASVIVPLLAILWYEAMGRWQSYSTPVGTVAPVALADGSRITLDSNSKVRVSLQSDRRVVRLDRGEALFDVAKDPLRPLVVEVDGNHVTAVGTSFSVRRDSDEIQVSVIQGQVKVDAGRERAVELEAGAEATTHRGTIVVDRPGLDEIERTLSWRDGYLVFQETPLPVAIAQFNRYRTQRIDIDDPSIDTIIIGGRFRCADSEGFLTLLEKGFAVTVTRDATHVSLRRSRTAM